MTPIPRDDPDWIRPAPAPLPVTVTPAHHETLASYLTRLAAANRLDPAALRTHITGDHHTAAAVPPARLATISGQPARVLRRALPELCHSPTDPDPLLALGGAPRPECVRCAAARGRPRPATVHAHHHDAVCRHHRLWLGDGLITSHHQPDLTGHPQILHANQAHRRLTHHHGLATTADAYRQAAWICRYWHDHHRHDQQLNQLLTNFHGTSWKSLDATDPTIQAAGYPQAVALTRLLASPHWQTEAHHTPPTAFITEIRRTVAPHYTWNPTSTAHPDPLADALRHHGTQHPTVPPT